MPDDVMQRDLWSAEIERLVSVGFAQVSRNPSDHETAIAYRSAIAAALTETQALRAEIARAREAGERETAARCIGIIHEQQAAFLSPEYAADQPFSSFAERFACGRCIEEIENELAGEATTIEEKNAQPLVDLISDPYLRDRVRRVCQQRDDALNALAVERAR